MTETENPKKRIYIVIDQGDNSSKELLMHLYGNYEIVWVYYKEVIVTTQHIASVPCSLFSFQELPEEETDEVKYNELCSNTKAMVSHCINDTDNRFIIWNFIPKVEHFGAYIHMLHMLEEKGKRLIFNVSLGELEKSMNENSTFLSLTKKHIDKGVVSILQSEKLLEEV